MHRLKTFKTSLWGCAVTALGTLVCQASEEQEYDGMDQSKHGESADPMEP